MILRLPKTQLEYGQAEGPRTEFLGGAFPRADGAYIRKAVEDTK